MLAVKGVKVHSDTHSVLKLIKVQKRSRSLDEVIRELVRSGTGKTVEQYMHQRKNAKLTSYMQQ